MSMREEDKSRRITRNIVYWSPRVLSMLVAIYAVKNVPDYVRAGASFGDSTIAILKHLIPAFVLALLIFVSWRREWLAAGGFIVLAVLRLAKDVSQSQLTHLWLVAIGSVIAALWMLNWKYRKDLRGQNATHPGR
jgi:hypothetical protein